MKNSTLFKLSDSSIILIAGDDELYFFDRKNIIFYTPETMMNEYTKFINDISSKTGDTYITNTKLVFDKNRVLRIKKQIDNNQEIDITNSFDVCEEPKTKKRRKVGEEKIMCFQASIFPEGFWVHRYAHEEETLFSHIFCCDNMIIEAKYFTRINDVYDHIRLTSCGINCESDGTDNGSEFKCTFKNYTEYSKFVKNKKMSQKLKNVIINPELFRATLRGESTKWIGRMNFRKKDRIKCDISFKFS